jgi:predicted adenylyl cyclase CyaB
MPSNIEIKFRVQDLDAVESKAVPIADHGPEILVQEDIFFNVSHGRLKLRKFADGSAELIAYHRSDSDTIRESQWHAYPTLNPDALQNALALTAGQSTIVRKKRTLYLIGKTRLHLDRVEDLGHFVELEVVLDKKDSHESGVTIANRLVESLGLESAEKIAVAYADLLHNKL